MKLLAAGGGSRAILVVAVGIALLLAGYQQGLVLCYAAGAGGLAFVTVPSFDREAANEGRVERLSALRPPVAPFAVVNRFFRNLGSDSRSRQAG